MLRGLMLVVAAALFCWQHAVLRGQDAQLPAPLPGDISGAVSVTDDESHDPNAALRESITVPELRAHIDFLADDALEGRAAGSRGGRAAASYLMQQLTKLKLRPAGLIGRFDQPFDGQMRNVLAIVEGSDLALKSEYILIGAHYDHVGYGTAKNSNGPIGYIHNGADDNASGTACLLELAQALQDLPIKPKRSIIIAFWDGEEIDLLGSKYWLKNPTVPLKQLRAAVNIDMVGRLRENKLYVYGTRTAAGWRRVVAECNATSEFDLDFTWEMKADSDHHPFFAAGVPIMMLHTGLHDEYHRPSDDTHRLNFPGIEQVTEYLGDITLALADELPVGKFREASRQETSVAQTALERPQPPLPGRLGIRWTEPTGDETGLLLNEIHSKGPAAKAGLKPGDRLLTMQGMPIPDGEEFRRWILAAPRVVEMTFERLTETEPRRVLVELEGEPIRWGITWRNDDAEPTLVLINRVVASSPAATAGIQVGDRVYAVNGQVFASSEAFQELIEADELELCVERAGRFHNLSLKPLAALPPIREANAGK